jgi:hypothetical protein
MATDPRIAAAAVGIAIGTSQGDVAVLHQRISDLSKRVAALERLGGIRAGSGPPTSNCRDGTLYVDITNSRLYARSASTWKSVVIA